MDAPMPQIAQPMPDALPLYLFSVDLEDVRRLLPDGDRYAERVPANSERLLECLERHGARCTWYSTGDVARRYPELIRRIADAGHEIGCHTNEHIPLDRQSPDTLRDDLSRCLDAYHRAGVSRCRGFRAPMGSISERTRWAYEVLDELGFTYSSSVCPASHPLYGWPEFGTEAPKRVGPLWEIPMTLVRFAGLNLPFAGGVYFRVLPYPVVRWLFARRTRSGYPVTGYSHPYDIDTEQERFMHPEIDGSRLYNWLLYYNRRGVLRNLERLFAAGYRVMRYDEFIEKHLEAREVAST